MSGFQLPWTPSTEAKIKSSNHHDCQCVSHHVHRSRTDGNYFGILPFKCLSSVGCSSQSCLIHIQYEFWIVMRAKKLLLHNLDPWHGFIPCDRGMFLWNMSSSSVPELVFHQKYFKISICASSVIDPKTTSDTETYLAMMALFILIPISWLVKLKWRVLSMWGKIRLCISPLELFFGEWNKGPIFCLLFLGNDEY